MIHNTNEFDNEKLLYGLTRSLFLFYENSQVLDEVIIATVLVLYKNWLKIQDTILSLPNFLAQNLNFPIEVQEEETIFEKNDSCEVPEKAFGLLKTYWNLAWFGGYCVAKLKFRNT